MPLFIVVVVAGAVVECVRALYAIPLFHSSFNLKQNANNCKTQLDSYNNCYTSHKWTENVCNFHV